jgi:hypothetical protein
MKRKPQPIFSAITSPQIFIGVDPGSTGALAFLGVKDGLIEQASIIDYADPNVKDYLRRVSDRAAFGLSSIQGIVEQVGMRPGQDVARQTKYVIHHGIVQGWLQMLSINYTIAHPRTWQAFIYKALDAGRSAFNYSDIKQRALAVARATYAGFPDILSALARAKDHNRADALMIAHYCYMQSL